VKRFLLKLSILLVGLCALEGLCSLALFAYTAAFESKPVLAERRHTDYDEQIGWVAQPGRKFADLYGPGRSLTTNSRGFRGTAEIAPQRTPGRPRLVCVGDSFTLGYGVDDAHAWPQVMQSLDPRLEVANLGQGGYGIDQFLLWRQRAAADLECDLLVCAFIPEDFERMCADTFIVYGKPYFELENGALELRNTPVPKRGYSFPWLVHNRALVNRLGIAGIYNRLIQPEPRRTERSVVIPQTKAPQVAAAIFSELAKAAQASGGQLVLVHLPSVDPRRLDRLMPLSGWPREVCDQAASNGARFIDLAPYFEALEPDARAALFLAEDAVQFTGAAGHYDEKGNEFVARKLLDELKPLLDAAAAR
jgi:lysophospholipase L1-like esterase